VLRYKEMGYQAIRAQSGVPGLEKVYGVGRGSMFYEPADAEPAERARLEQREIPAAHAQAVRRGAPGRGPRHPFAARRAPPPDAHRGGRLGKSLEPYHLFWIEDATPAENQEAFRLIRQHTTTPLAVGEIFNSIWDCKD
jgi:mannonate dehydratase